MFDRLFPSLEGVALHKVLYAEVGSYRIQGKSWCSIQNVSAIFGGAAIRGSNTTGVVLKLALSYPSLFVPSKSFFVVRSRNHSKVRALLTPVASAHK